MHGMLRFAHLLHFGRDWSHFSLDCWQLSHARRYFVGFGAGTLPLTLVSFSCIFDSALAIDLIISKQWQHPTRYTQHVDTQEYAIEIALEPGLEQGHSNCIGNGEARPIH
jgi:hypothetical protein